MDAESEEAAAAAAAAAAATMGLMKGEEDFVERLSGVSLPPAAAEEGLGVDDLGMKDDAEGDADPLAAAGIFVISTRSIEAGESRSGSLVDLA